MFGELTWRTSLFDCKINFILAYPANHAVFEGNTAIAFVTTGTKLYVPVVTLSAHDNAKLLQLLKSYF